MSEHLPECLVPNGGVQDFCICPELRACEQRVIRPLPYYDAGVEDGYAKGLRAARYAVAVQLTQMGYDTESTNPYLAAIDKLLEGDDE